MVCTIARFSRDAGRVAIRQRSSFTLSIGQSTIEPSEKRPVPKLSSTIDTPSRLSSAKAWRTNFTVRQRRLRDFQFEPRRRKARGGKGVLDRGDEIVAAELDGRQIDRDDLLASPSGGVPASRFERPAANIEEHPRFLGEGNETSRRQQALLGMAPAQQRLASDNCPGRDVDDGLVGEFDLVLSERLAQVDFQSPPFADFHVHPGFEQATRAATIALGLVERQIRVAERIPSGRRRPRENASTPTVRPITTSLSAMT